MAKLCWATLVALMLNATSQANKCAPGCEDSYVGDSECHASCNNADCEFDGGDCPRPEDDESEEDYRRCHGGVVVGANENSKGAEDADETGAAAQGPMKLPADDEAEDEMTVMEKIMILMGDVGFYTICGIVAWYLLGTGLMLFTMLCRRCYQLYRKQVKKDHDYEYDAHSYVDHYVARFVTSYFGLVQLLLKVTSGKAPLKVVEDPVKAAESGALITGLTAAFFIHFVNGFMLVWLVLLFLFAVIVAMISVLVLPISLLFMFVLIKLGRVVDGVCDRALEKPTESDDLKKGSTKAKTRGSLLTAVAAAALLAANVAANAIRNLPFNTNVLCCPPNAPCLLKCMGCLNPPELPSFDRWRSFASWWLDAFFNALGITIKFMLDVLMILSAVNLAIKLPRLWMRPDFSFFGVPHFDLPCFMFPKLAVACVSTVTVNAAVVLLMTVFLVSLIASSDIVTFLYDRGSKMRRLQQDPERNKNFTMKDYLSVYFVICSSAIVWRFVEVMCQMGARAFFELALYLVDVAAPGAGIVLEEGSDGMCGSWTMYGLSKIVGLWSLFLAAAFVWKVISGKLHANTIYIVSVGLLESQNPSPFTCCADKDKMVKVKRSREWLFLIYKLILGAYLWPTLNLGVAQRASERVPDSKGCCCISRWRKVRDAIMNPIEKAFSGEDALNKVLGELLDEAEDPVQEAVAGGCCWRLKKARPVQDGSGPSADGSKRIGKDKIVEFKKKLGHKQALHRTCAPDELKVARQPAVISGLGKRIDEYLHPQASCGCIIARELGRRLDRERDAAAEREAYEQKEAARGESSPSSPGDSLASRGDKSGTSKGKCGKCVSLMPACFLMPFGIFSDSVLKSTSISQKAYLWDADIDDSQRCMGNTVGVIFQLIPAGGIFVGKVCQYLNSYPTWIWSEDPEIIENCFRADSIEKKISPSGMDLALYLTVLLRVGLLFFIFWKFSYIQENKMFYTVVFAVFCIALMEVLVGKVLEKKSSKDDPIVHAALNGAREAGGSVKQRAAAVQGARDYLAKVKDPLPKKLSAAVARAVEKKTKKGTNKEQASAVGSRWRKNVGRVAGEKAGEQLELHLRAEIAYAVEKAVEKKGVDPIQAHTVGETAAKSWTLVEPKDKRSFPCGVCPGSEHKDDVGPEEVWVEVQDDASNPNEHSPIQRKLTDPEVSRAASREAQERAEGAEHRISALVAELRAVAEAQESAEEGERRIRAVMKQVAELKAFESTKAKMEEAGEDERWDGRSWEVDEPIVQVSPILDARRTDAPPGRPSRVEEAGALRELVELQDKLKTANDQIAHLKEELEVLASEKTLQVQKEQKDMRDSTDTLVQEAEEQREAAETRAADAERQMAIYLREVANLEKAVNAMVKERNSESRQCGFGAWTCCHSRDREPLEVVDNFSYDSRRHESYRVTSL